MAGGKEYTLTFLLKAAADSSYQAAFAKAKQELNDFQKQIQQNNSLLKDISAYERQEQAVQRAAEKVAEKTKALEEATAAAERAGNADEKLNKAQTNAAAAVKTATEKLNQQQKKLEDQGEALQRAGVNTDNLAQEQTRLKTSTEELKQEQEALAGQQNKWIDSMAEMEAVAAEAYTAIQVVEKFADALEACIEAASGFQYAMSATEAVSQATSSEMEELTAVAKEVGATTIFTATEIAQAMEYMGLAGWSAEEMIEGIPSVANLAAASGENLSRVCDIVTDSMMALGYGTESTERFCDVLAQTARTANTNVDKMGDTLKYVSSTAGALNYSIEDVATAMADLANSGIKSGMAGTSLRNILASLADPSDEAAEALEALNIHLGNAEGEAYALNDVITQMRQAFAGLTQIEKVQYASMIAGKRGMTGVLALVNTTQEAYDELAATISDCDGAAEQMAGTRLDNFQGQTIILESAWDALKTSIGEAFLDIGQEGAETLTLITNGLNDFVKSNESVVLGLSAAVGMFFAMATGITAVTTAVKLLSTVFSGTMLANPTLWGFTAIISGIAGIATAIVNVMEREKDAKRSTEELLSEIQVGQENRALIEEYYEVSEAMQETGLTAEETAEYESWLAEVVEQLKQEYPELLGNIDAGTDAWDMQTAAILANIDATENANIADLADDANAYAKSFVNAAEAYREAEEEAKETLEDMQELENVDFQGTYDKVQELYDSLTEGLEDQTIEVDLEEGSDFYNKIQEIQKEAQKISGEELDFTMASDVSEWLEEYKDGAAETYDVMATYSQKYADAMNTMADKQNLMDGYAASLRGIADAGYSVAVALEAAGLSVEDIGISYESIGQEVSTGTLTARQAMVKYGLTAGQVTEAIQAYIVAQQEAADATGESAASAQMSKLEYDRLVYALQYVGDETLTAQQAADVFGLELDDLNARLEEQEEYEENVAGAVAAVDNNMMTAEGAAERFGVSLEAMDAYRAATELEKLQTELEELQDAYDSAYDSALSSIQSQGSLLEGLSLAADRTKLTVGDALANMQEIESYWSDYQTNLEKLQGYGLTTDFLTRFCDTSADGVANAQDLARELENLGSEEAAQERASELQKAFEDMAEAEESTAGTTADLETQFSTTAAAIEQRMQELEDEVAADMNSMVSSMDQSETAYTNGVATASAFVSGIRSKIEAARTAAAELAAAGTPSSSSSSSTGGKAHGGFTNGPELAGEDPSYPVEAVISFNPKYREENIGYVQQAAAMLGMDVEDDTENASKATDYSGYTYGGLTEYGSAMLQELSRYSTTERAPEAPTYEGSGSGGSQAYVSYAPVIQVTASTSRQEILDMLHQYDEQLADKFMEFQSNLERNERRTRYV